MDQNTNDLTLSDLNSWLHDQNLSSIEKDMVDSLKSQGWINNSIFLRTEILQNEVLKVFKEQQHKYIPRGTNVVMMLITRNSNICHSQFASSSLRRNFKQKNYLHT